MLFLPCLQTGQKEHKNALKLVEQSCSVQKLSIQQIPQNWELRELCSRYRPPTRRPYRSPGGRRNHLSMSSFQLKMPASSCHNQRIAPSGADRAPNQSGAGSAMPNRTSAAQGPEGTPSDELITRSFSAEAKSLLGPSAAALAAAKREDRNDFNDLVPPSVKGSLSERMRGQR